MMSSLSRPPYFNALNEQHLASPGPRITPSQRRPYPSTVIASSVDQRSRQPNDFTYSHPGQLLLNARINRNHMSVCTVRADRVAREWHVSMRPPRIESSALRDIQCIENLVIRHRPPSERQILGHQAGQRIESIALITQNPRRNVVVGPGSQCPTAMQDGGSRRYVRLQGVLFCNLACGRMHAPVSPQAPAIPQARNEQPHEKCGTDIDRWHTLKYEP
jgi:hypothetical protein